MNMAAGERGERRWVLREACGFLEPAFKCTLLLYNQKEGRTLRISFSPSTTIPTILFWGEDMQLVQPGFFAVDFLFPFTFFLKSGIWIWCYIANQSIGNCVLEVKTYEGNIVVYILFKKCSCAFTNTIKKEYFLFYVHIKVLYLLQLCTVKRSLF